MADPLERRAIVPLAWLNVGLHAAGLGAALLWLRPGTPSVSPAARLSYLAARPLGWTLGWSLWMLCALALVAFLAAVPALLGRARFPATLGSILAASGAAIDLLCDALYVLVLPGLAVEGPVPLFFAAERAIAVGSLVVANGLYSVAVLLATFAIRADGRAGPAQAWLGGGAGVAGLVLAAAGWIGSPPLTEVATGPTIALFMAWTLVASRRLAAVPAA